MQQGTGGLCKKPSELTVLRFLICSVLIICSTLAVNWGARLRGLYLDDLSTWIRIDTTRIVDYVFSIGANKFRPINGACMFLMARISNMNPGILGYWLLGFHAAIAMGVFAAALLISKSYFVSFVLAMAYQISRFSYYNVTQFFGIMETLGMVFAVVMLLLLFVAIKRDIVLSELICLSYFCATFSHERYLVLFPVVLYTSFCVSKKRYKLKLAIESLLTFACIFLVRSVVLGNKAFEGTGGTDVTETFSFILAFRYAVSQLLYLFGWNAGPEYLSGYEMGNYGIELKAVIVCMDICIVLMCMIVLVAVARNKEQLCQTLKIVGLFFIFIAMCIASSSVTIRVEMRWIYVSFAAMLLLMAYLFAAVKASKRGLAIAMGAVIGVYGLCSCVSDAELRTGWNRLYFYDEKSLTDSLYDLTYAKYGDEFWYKKLILVDREGADTEQIRAWLNTFRKGNLADHMTIESYGNFREMDVSALDTNSVILYRNYRDYSDYSDYYHTFVKDRVVTILGFDKSGWIEQHAEFDVYTDASGEVVLNLSTDQAPDETWNGRTVNVYADGELVCQTVMDEKNKRIVIPSEANSRVSFRIENGFVDENVEIEGAKRCYKLSISI